MLRFFARWRTQADRVAARPLRVLFSFRPPSGDSNPYVQLLIAALGSDVSIAFFSWRSAILGRYDVFHIHWPETLLRGRSAGRRIVSQVLTAILIARLRLTRVRVVRTLHNVTPHEEGSCVEQGLLKIIDNNTAAWIVMNADDSVDALRLDPARVWRVPHGHFRQWYAPMAKDVIRPTYGQLLLFGQIRPYKGVESLLDIFDDLGTASPLRLVIAGRALSPDLRCSIMKSASRATNVRALLRYITDEELVGEIQACHMVILPYRRMLNSGAVFAALSLGRPVLVPRNYVNECLAAEVGTMWVQMYDEPLTADKLMDALENAPLSAVVAGSPNLDARDWSRIAEAHYNAYLGRRPLSAEI